MTDSCTTRKSETGSEQMTPEEEITEAGFLVLRQVLENLIAAHEGRPVPHPEDLSPERITPRLEAISRVMHELAAERNRLLELRLRLSIVPARTALREEEEP